MTTARLLTILLLSLLTAARAAAEAAPPEPGSGRQTKALVTAKEFMIVAAHPAAAKAGYDVLARGGTAMDAAVATQMVLNLVEPQSSGIGGGAFLVYYDAASSSVTTLDGREIAPSSIKPDRFLDADGKPLPWWDRITGGGSVGVPGTLKLIEDGHRRFGRETFAELLRPAITLAREGFIVSPRMAHSIAEAERRGLTRFDTTRAYFFDADGSPRAAGSTLTNPAFADTLEQIAESGSAAFYSGKIGHDIVATVNDSRPGSISLNDLKSYQVVERPPVCAPFRRFRVCGMGPPSSGALTVGQILGIWQHVSPGPTGFDVDAIHRLSEAEKLAFADRARYMADSDFVSVPIAGLLDPRYLAERATLIHPDSAMAKAAAGAPPRLDIASRLAPDPGDELPGTSQISIFDRYGNALSMTTTIESGFGSRLMTHGFLLNNELTDFSPVAEIDGEPVANRIEPGKRPRSSMAPTIVLGPDGSPVLVLGSPGGSAIITFVAETLIRVLDFGMDVQTAVSLPHFGNRNGDTELEADTAIADLAGKLESLGHTISLGEMTSGLHAIAITPGGILAGGADPRREGVALGE